ncbi:ABC transporter permease [Streptomyces sp. NPDC052114]|uniref:ABC transporter permease n=1 Tax=unclassified Streptomyces TaxID=2593676 RepID=UPI0034398247
MTTSTHHTAPTTNPVGQGRAQDPGGLRPRFRDLVAAEWLKLWAPRSTGWALLIAGLAVLAFNTGTAYDTYRYWSENDARDRARFVRDGIPLQEAFTTNAALVLMLSAGAVGALALVSEHRTGLIRTTFAAVPARRSLMTAKVLVTAAVMTVFGAAVAGGSFWLTQAILSGRGVGVPLGHPGAWRLVVASALLAPVAALAGLALGAVLRHGGTTMVASFVVLLLLPIVLSEDRHWTAVLGHATPYKAWLRLVDPAAVQGAHPSTAAGAWLVLAVWPVAAAVVAVLTVDRRDV